MHGFLAYAMGLVLVLSAVYGVAHSVGNDAEVVTDSATSSRWHVNGRAAWEDAGTWFRSWSGHRSAQAAGAPAAAPAAGAVPSAAAPTPADVPQGPVAVPPQARVGGRARR